MVCRRPSLRSFVWLLALLAGSLTGCAGRAATARPTTPSVARGPEALVDHGAELAIPADSGAGEPAASDPPRAWLYRATAPSGATSYVLGTMHVGVAFTRALPPPLDGVLYDAETVVMEIDLREAVRFLADAPRVRRSRREWLDRQLPPETWSRLTTELAYVAAPEEIAPLPAGLLATYLRQVRMAEVEAADDGWARIPGTASPTHLDRWIFEWTMSWGVPFVALETPEETVAALSSIPRDEPVDVLRAIVDDPETARAEARRLRAAYLSLHEEEVVEALSSMSDAERHATFAVRNEAWMAPLTAAIDAGGAFAAVGLAHLVGEGSLVELLRARGYDIERVRGDGGLVPTDGADHRVWTHAPPRRPY